jgi:NitT/TauT family transport system substrate-binding protein
VSARLSRARALAATTAFVGFPALLRAQALEKIRIAAVPTDDMTPIFYAIKNGAYQKVGLDVEVVPINSGSASTAAVVSGAYEMGKASPMGSLLAHLRGLPLTIVANGAVWIPRSPFNLVLVAADSPIRTAADCNGKVGGAPGLNDVAQLGLNNWVDKNGGDSKTIKWVEIPNSAGAAALAEHRIDMMDLNEPQLTAALETGKIRRLADAFTSIAERWVASVYLAQPDWARKNADAVKRWVKVTYDTTGYTNAHKAETLEMMSETTKIPLNVFRKISRIEGTTTADPALLEPVMELGLRYKVLPRSFPVKEMYFTP